MKYKSRRYKTALAVWRKNYVTPRNISCLAILLFVFIVIGPAILALIMQSSYSSRIIQKVEDVKTTKVGIVLGEVVGGNSISDAVEERIEASVDLYKAGKIQKLIISGDIHSSEQNSPQKMMSRAVQLGISSKDIIVDGSSLRTYDSCYRAKNIYGLNDAILISQPTQLARALFICNSLGVRATGYAAHIDNLSYSEDSIRELMAFVKSVYDVNIFPPQDVAAGDKIEIK